MANVQRPVSWIQIRIIQKYREKKLTNSIQNTGKLIPLNLFSLSFEESSPFCKFNWTRRYPCIPMPSCCEKQTKNENLSKQTRVFLTGCITIDVWCFSLFGESPSIPFIRDLSPLKKWGWERAKGLSDEKHNKLFDNLLQWSHRNSMVKYSPVLFSNKFLQDHNNTMYPGRHADHKKHFPTTQTRKHQHQKVFPLWRSKMAKVDTSIF